MKKYDLTKPLALLGRPFRASFRLRDQTDQVDQSGAKLKRVNPCDWYRCSEKTFLGF